jgi:hypothetical protein
MKLTRIYAGDDGESHFEYIDLTDDTSFPGRAISETISATRAGFGNSRAVDDQDWHNAPRRQLVAVLAGTLEIECGDGSMRLFPAGDSFIADDLTGRGHRTRYVATPVRLLYVHLPDGLDFSAWRT